jgi:hypothetical protein
MAQLRPELKDLPERMQDLPIDSRGYPVPRFVQNRAGEPDFRFMSLEHWKRCVEQHVCWVCGDRLGVRIAFVVGPMCIINETTSEPPCHRECAIWSARFCPFLSRPHMVRREDELTAQARGNSAGCPILRNPGAAAVLMTRTYQLFDDGGGRYLIQMGEPTEVLWFAEGREATRAEVEESIRTGMPSLEALARLEKGGMEELARRRAGIEKWLPPRKKPALAK